MGAVRAGELEVNGVALKAGDGVAVSDEPALSLKGNGAGASCCCSISREPWRVTACQRPRCVLFALWKEPNSWPSRPASVPFRREPTYVCGGSLTLPKRRRFKRTSEWTTHLDRMNRDYVVPRPADPVWADVIVLAVLEDSSIELEQYVASLRSIGSMGQDCRAADSGDGESTLAPDLCVGRSRRLDRRPAARRGRRHRERARTRPARRRHGARAQGERTERAWTPPPANILGSSVHCCTPFDRITMRLHS